MLSARMITRDPFCASALKSVKGWRKCAASAACHCSVVRVVIGTLSDMEQQVLAFPRRDHLHELGVLDFLDLGVDRDEGLSQHFGQILLGTQQAERLAEAARQLEVA